VEPTQATEKKADWRSCAERDDAKCMVATSANMQKVEETDLPARPQIRRRAASTAADETDSCPIAGDRRASVRAASRAKVIDAADPVPARSASNRPRSIRRILPAANNLCVARVVCVPCVQSISSPAERRSMSSASAPTRILGDTDLINADLLPSSPEQRTWDWKAIAALWVGMVVCVPAYMLAAGMVSDGMSWKQAVGTILLANVIVLIPMLLIGHAGAKHGIPFPVLLRASFGTRGARLPAVLRGLVACGWFGIQTWVGGAAIYTIVNVLTDNGIVGS